MLKVERNLNQKIDPKVFKPIIEAKFSHTFTNNCEEQKLNYTKTLPKFNNFHTQYLIKFDIYYKYPFLLKLKERLNPSPNSQKPSKTKNTLLNSKTI